MNGNPEFQSPLIVITRSDDGTINLLEKHKSREWHRVNIDEPESWSLQLTEDSWTLSTKETTLDQFSSASCWWWKALNFEERPNDYLESEKRYILQEFYMSFFRQQRVKGNSYFHHISKGKLHYLNAAKPFFTIPKTAVTLGQKTSMDFSDAVVKSLSSTPITSTKILYTTRVELTELDPKYPWFIQEFIHSEVDITVVIIGDSFRGFQRIRKKGSTVDWRSEQKFDPMKSEWTPAEFTQEEELNIHSFIKAVDLDWGRIDLMRCPDGQLCFLEINANGQFAFLDYSNETGLISEVVKYLDLV